LRFAVLEIKLTLLVSRSRRLGHAPDANADEAA